MINTSQIDLADIVLPPHLRNATLIEFKDYLASIDNPQLRELLETTFLLGIKLGNSKPVTVVVMLHGILTDAVWHDKLERLIQDESQARSYKISYGLFDAIGLFCPPPVRHWHYKHVLKEMRNARATYPNARMIVIAHSFGTYLICRILRKNFDIRIEKLVLCGSIVKERFPWETLPNFPQDGVLNECGTKDNWPVIARAITFGYGASGRLGFQSGKIDSRYHDVGHSGFFNENFFREYWLPVITEGKLVPSDWTTKRPAAPHVVQFLFEGSLFLLLILAIAIVLAI